MSVADVDAVFLLGGDCKDLVHGNKINEHLVRIIDNAVSEKLPLVSCSNGWNVLDATGIMKKNEFKGVRFNKTHKPTDLAKQASSVFGELRQTIQ